MSRASFRSDCPSPSSSKHPFRSRVELPHVDAHASAPWNAVQPPSGSDQESESVSGQPYLSELDVPTTDVQESGFTPPGLSPKLSPSESDHCVPSLGKSSPTLDHPSPSPSGHPVWSCVEEPAVFGQSSRVSMNPSPSASAEMLIIEYGASITIEKC